MRRAEAGRNPKVTALFQVRGVNGSGSSPAPGTPQLCGVPLIYLLRFALPSPKILLQQ